MSLFLKTHALVIRSAGTVIVCALFVLLNYPSRAACVGCTGFQAGVLWGTHTDDRLNEASGLAASALNPGVLWSHNDNGSANVRLYAFLTNGTALARFRIRDVSLSDIEDLAIGPGPNPGISYIYAADIGGSDSINEVRNEIRIARMAEPTVSPALAGNPGEFDFANVQVFTLKYPSFFFWDAETMFVDPLNGDLYVGSKHNNGCWLYRANLNEAAPGSTNEMEFAVYVPFSDASGGAISHDGSQIALRNEDFAQTWLRCDGESISNALSRAGQVIPVIARPTEPNGEAIAFLPGGRGYVTVSDSHPAPPIYYFAPTCAPTVITQQPESTEVAVGDSAQFAVEATGENLQYQWRFNGADLPGQVESTLALANVQTTNAGQYSVRIVGNGGAVTSNPAMLAVAILPPTIVVQPPLSTLAATGSTVTIVVGVDGTEPLQYSWTLGRKVVSDSAALTFTNVSRKNAGKYRVTVSNSAGQVTSGFATLKVLNPPVIKAQPLSRTAAVGKSTTLRVRAAGSPRLGYQWFFNDEPIANATKPALTLRGLQPEQGGQYSVSITNAVGGVTSEAAELLVQ